MRIALACLIIALALPVPAIAADTVPAPASKAASGADEAKERDETVGDHTRYKTTVVGAKDLKESDPVGDYQQPVWTAKRRFPTTRVYVIPAGGMTVEYWLTTEGKMSGDSQPSYEHRLELEFGLGRRLQLDLYFVWGQDGSAAPIDMTEQSIEIRYAFADWGVLWGNPTLYVEWVRQNAGPQKMEGKLLLGGQITPAWFWGFNVVYERAMGGESEGEYALAAGASRVLVQNRLNLGIEAKASFLDVQGSRFDFVEKKVTAGPSLQVKPVPGVFVDLVPMAGARAAGNVTEAVYVVYFIIGKEL